MQAQGDSETWEETVWRGGLPRASEKIGAVTWSRSPYDAVIIGTAGWLVTLP